MDEQKISMVWSDWRVVRLIGRGSFGSVYEIERDQFGMKERATVKILTIPQDQSYIDRMYSDGYDNETVVSRMNEELQSVVKEYYFMAELKGHTNIVNCMDLKYIRHSDDPGWDVLIRMELLKSLNAALENGMDAQKAGATALKAGQDICQALILCEEKKVVHRDIKPQNIFLSEFGDYKLGDFGTAKAMEHTTGGTKTGTYKFMSPEVYIGRPYGHSADLYSLGLVLYWLLNERRMPFLPLPPAVPTASDESGARARRFRGDPIPEPRNGSAALKAVVLKACAYEPKDRFASAVEMLAALRRAEGGRRTETPNAAHGGAGQKQENNLNGEKAAADSHRDGRILGICFGSTEVYVSYLPFMKNGKAGKVLSMPAYVTITEVGEVLAGSRAERYRTYHPDAPLYSVLEVMRQGGWKKTAKVTCRGMEIHALRMCDCLMCELRRQLDQTDFRTAGECVVAAPSSSYLFREYLTGIMERAGFTVRRILNASAACALYTAFLMGDESADKSFFACAVSNDVSESCLMDYTAGVAEIICKSEHPLSAEGGRKAGDIVSAARQKMQKILRMQFGEDELPDLNSEGYVFAEGDVMAHTANVNALCASAAAGAALQGAKLSGNSAAENILLLDATSMAYGLEVLNASDGRKIQELQWAIKENTTIPMKKTITYDRRNVGKDMEESLVLHIGHTYGNSFSEKISVDMGDFLPIMRGADTVELTVDINSSDRDIGIRVTDPVSKKTESKQLFLSTTRVPITPKSRQIDQGKLLAAIWKEMRNFHQALSRLPHSELNSPTGQGLRQVEKQCTAFLSKHGLAYEIPPKRVTGEGAAMGLLYEILEIADSLEYGMRGRTAGGRQPSEILLSGTYLAFQRALEDCANVRPVEAEGCAFDVNLHSAASYETNGEMDHLAVIGELKRGYFWGEELLRPAVVRVAK